MAENINTLLDRLYYQQIVAAQDAKQLENMRKQISLLSVYKKQIEEQKQNVLFTMAKIHDKKDKING